MKRLRWAEEELRRADAVLRRLDTRRPYYVLQNLAVYEREMRFMDTSRPRSLAAWTADQRDLREPIVGQPLGVSGAPNEGGLNSQGLWLKADGLARERFVREAVLRP